MQSVPNIWSSLTVSLIKSQEVTVYFWEQSYVFQMYSKIKGIWLENWKNKLH